MHDTVDAPSSTEPAVASASPMRRENQLDDTCSISTPTHAVEIDEASDTEQSAVMSSRSTLLEGTSDHGGDDTDGSYDETGDSDDGDEGGILESMPIPLRIILEAAITENILPTSIVNPDEQQDHQLPISVAPTVAFRSEATVTEIVSHHDEITSPSSASVLESCLRKQQNMMYIQDKLVQIFFSSDGSPCTVGHDRHAHRITNGGKFCIDGNSLSSLAASLLQAVANGGTSIQKHTEISSAGYFSPEYILQPTPVAIQEAQDEEFSLRMSKLKSEQSIPGSGSRGSIALTLTTNGCSGNDGQSQHEANTGSQRPKAAANNQRNRLVVTSTGISIAPQTATSPVLSTVQVTTQTGAFCESHAGKRCKD
ncbi:hypothetical protein BGW41_001926 [Actinomortierella wolfii]|nr:hypothetical protein BGW41_001926 [Actinomortierella wolfii]